MSSKYLRLPQDASDLLPSGNEKKGNSHQPHWKNLILSLSLVVNIALCLSFVLMMREKHTPDGFGEHQLANRVRVPTDQS